MARSMTSAPASMDFLVVADERTRHLDGFINGRGGGGAGSILESEAVERDVAVKDLFQTVDVELRGVRIRFMQVRRKSHHCDGDLMFESVAGNGLSGDIKVADVVESVEVADGGHAVLFEELGMQVDDVAGLGREADHVHSAGEGLEIDAGTDGCAPFVHHFESIFLAVEIEALEAGAAADFNVADARFHRGFKSGKEIIRFNPGTEA